MIQPLRLFYSENIVTHQRAVIFVSSGIDRSTSNDGGIEESKHTPIKITDVDLRETYAEKIFEEVFDFDQA